MPKSAHLQGADRTPRQLGWLAPRTCARAALIGASLLVGADTLARLYDDAEWGALVTPAYAHSGNSGSGSSGSGSSGSGSTSSGSGSSGSSSTGSGSGSTGSGTSSTNSTTYKSDGGGTSSSGSSFSGSGSSSSGQRSSERTSDGDSLARKEASELSNLLDDDADPQNALRRTNPPSRGKVGTESGGKSEGGGTARPAYEPPKTQAEALDKFMKPAGARSVEQGPAANPATAKSQAAGATQTTAKPKTATGGRRPGVLEPIGGGSYARGEVLALNLSNGALQRARALGFDVSETSSLSQLGSSLTKLFVPPGLDAAAARDLLKSNLPKDQFELNSIYRLYKPAIDGVMREAQRTAPAARPGFAAPCMGDRCVGRELIGWNDNLSSCSRNLRVGMIDTGIDHEHPAFVSGRLRSGNFIPQGRTAAPTWHGTGVLALMAGDPRGGTPGLIPMADFYVASIFFNDGAGDFATDTVSLLKALDWISAFDVKLVNLSFAGPKNEEVAKAIATMSAKGVIFVAAAGNEGPTAAPSYPAAYKPVIAVTAVNKDRRNYPFASRGEHIDVAAPGVDIYTAVPGAKEGYYSGTSFATPYVTAALATIYASSTRPVKEDLLARLELADLGPPGRDSIYGRGLLSAPNACRPAPAPATAGVMPPAKTASPPTAPSSWQANVMGVGASPTPRTSPTLSAGFR